MGYFNVTWFLSQVLSLGPYLIVLDLILPYSFRSYLKLRVILNYTIFQQVIFEEKSRLATYILDTPTIDAQFWQKKKEKKKSPNYDVL